MKRQLYSAIILVLFFVGLFLVGWMQLRLPANSVGVIYTKTGGWRPGAVRHGEFVWLWEQLLPTNTTLYIYPSRPRTATLVAESELPSATFYSSFIPGAPDLTYAVTLSLTYGLRENDLPLMARRDGLTPDALEEWYSLIERRIETAVAAIVRELGDSSLRPRLEIETEIASRLSGEFEEIDIARLLLHHIAFPDRALYAAAKNLYFDALERRETSTTDVIFAESNRRLQATSNIAILRELAAVLAEVPEVVQYLSLLSQDNSPLDNLFE